MHIENWNTHPHTDPKDDIIDDDSKWYGEIEDKPEMEQNLFRCQKEYLFASTREEKDKAWQEMFLLIKKYSRSLILKKNKGSWYKDPDDIEDSAIQTASSFMELYLKSKNFSVGASFAGLLNLKVLELYKNIKDDDCSSLNALQTENLEFEDLQEVIHFTDFMSHQRQDSDWVDNYNMFVKQLRNYIDDDTTYIKVLQFLILKLKGPKNKHIMPCFLKYICDYKTTKIINLIDLKLYKDLVSQSSS